MPAGTRLRVERDLACQVIEGELIVLARQRTRFRPGVDDRHRIQIRDTGVRLAPRAQVLAVLYQRRGMRERVVPNVLSGHPTLNLPLTLRVHRNRETRAHMLTRARRHGETT